MRYFWQELMLSFRQADGAVDWGQVLMALLTPAVVVMIVLMLFSVVQAFVLYRRVKNLARPWQLNTRKMLDYLDEISGTISLEIDGRLVECHVTLLSVWYDGKRLVTEDTDFQRVIDALLSTTAVYHDGEPLQTVEIGGRHYLPLIYPQTK